MVTLETSYKELKETVGKKFSIQELEDALFDLGMELDEVQGDLLKVDITPDRPDMVSTQGLSRTLRSFFGLKNPEYKVIPSEHEVIIDPSVSNVRPYTVSTIIKNLNLDDQKIKEIIWVQEKLHATFGRNRKKAAIGIYPLENIKLPISYKADKPENISFTPLEHEKEMKAKEILEKTSVGKDYAHLLKDFNNYPFFSDAKGDILSMPPIVNSHLTGKITKETKEVFIECSGFDMQALNYILNILVYMFQDMGSDVYSMNLKYPDKKITTPVLEKEKRTIKPDFIKKMTGLELSPKECAKFLERMLYEITNVKDDEIEFLVPPIRTDIWHDVDIADDIVRAYGINNIQYQKPEVSTEGGLMKISRLRETIIDLMQGLGFQEAFTLALTDRKDQFNKMKLVEGKYIKLGHTTEQSLNMVRAWLLPELFKMLQHNRHVEFPQKIFEINNAVVPDETKDVLSRDELKLSVLLQDKSAGYTPIRQVIEYIFDSIGIDYKIEEKDHSSFIKGRCATLYIDDEELGVLGEIHPEVIENWELEFPAAGAEINISMLVNKI
ncbi:MAG: phenylalanine--tRNA ligase subunit beta [Nanoarchaeota archaeon]